MASLSQKLTETDASKPKTLSSFDVIYPTDPSFIRNGTYKKIRGIVRKLKGFKIIQGVMEASIEKKFLLMTVCSAGDLEMIPKAEEWIDSMYILGKHPNIMGLHTSMMEDRLLYIVTNAIRSGNLELEMQPDGALRSAMQPIQTMLKKLDVIIQLAQGLKWAHDHGIAHLSLAPNIVAVNHEAGTQQNWLQILIGRFAEPPDENKRRNRTGRLAIELWDEVDSLEYETDDESDGEEEGEGTGYEEVTDDHDIYPLGDYLYRAPEQAQELYAGIGTCTDFWSFGVLAMDILLSNRLWTQGEEAGKALRTQEANSQFFQMWGVGSSIQKLLSECLVPRPAGRTSNWREIIENFKMSFEKLANYFYFRESGEEFEKRAENRSVIERSQMCGMWNLYIKNDRVTAQKHFEIVLDADPHNVAVLQNFGLILYKFIGDYERSINMFERCLDEAPLNSTALFYSAVIMYKNKCDADGAVLCLRRLLRLHPNHVKGYTLCAVIHHHTLRLYTDAKEFYEKALEVDPNAFRALMNFALLQQYQLKDYDAAEDLYKRALKVRPNSGVCMENLADILYYQKNRPAEAAILYRKLLQSSPRHVEATCKLGHIMVNVFANEAQAEILYQNALASNSKHLPTLLNYGYLCHAILNQPERGEEFYRTAIGISELCFEAMINLAQLLCTTKGDHDGAVVLEHRAAKTKSYVEAHAKNPNSKITLNSSNDDMEISAATTLYGGPLSKTKFQPATYLAERLYKVMEELELRLSTSPSEASKPIPFLVITVVEQQLTKEIFGLFSSDGADDEITAVREIARIGSHPNIAGLHDCYYGPNEGDIPLIVTTCVAPEFLSEMVKRGELITKVGSKSTAICNITDVIIQILLGLEWLHTRAKIAHGHLCPSNIAVVRTNTISGCAVNVRIGGYATKTAGQSCIVRRALTEGDLNRLDQERLQRKLKQQQDKEEEQEVRKMLAKNKNAHMPEEVEGDDEDGDDDEDGEGNTKKGKSHGDPMFSYRSPEQEDGTVIANAQSDVWSVGCIGLVLLTKVPFWDNGGDAGLYIENEQLLSEDIGELKSTSEEYIGVLRQCLHSDRKKRPVNLEEIALQLRKQWERPTGKRYPRSFGEHVKKRHQLDSTSKSQLLLATWSHAIWKRPKDAKKHYTQVLAVDPCHLRALLQFARLEFYDLKDSEAALQLLDRLLHEDPNHVQGLVDKGRVLMQDDAALERLKESEQCLRKALTIQPNHAEANFLLAILLRMVGRQSEAEDVYEVVLKRDPRMISGLFIYAEYLHYHKLNFDKAVYLYERIAYIDPNSAGAYFQLGHIQYLARDDPEGAKKFFEKSLECDSRYAPALFWMGHLYYHVLNDAKAAERYYLRAIQQENSPNVVKIARTFYGYLLHKEFNNADGAQAQYEKVLTDMDAKFVPALVNLAHLLYTSKQRPEEAQELWFRIIHVDRDTLPVLFGGPLTEYDRVMTMYKKRHVFPT